MFILAVHVCTIVQTDLLSCRDCGGSLVVVPFVEVYVDGFRDLGVRITVVYKYLGGSFQFFMDGMPAVTMRECSPYVCGDGGALVSVRALTTSIEAKSWVCWLAENLGAESLGLLVY